MLEQALKKSILILVRSIARKHPELGFCVQFPDGSIFNSGTLPISSKLCFNEWRVIRKLFGRREQSIVFGEAFARGEIEIFGNISALMWAIYSSGSRWKTPFVKRHKKARQKRFSVREQHLKVESIYDGLDELYRLILDQETMSYTVGLFDKKLPSIDEVYVEALGSSTSQVAYEHNVMEKLARLQDRDATALVSAQRRKIDLICRKALTVLGLTDGRGLRVLDIGCGWGGLACHFAREYGAKVVAMTISQDQLQTVRTLSERENLDMTVVRAHYKDFQDDNRFDIVTAVGMLEHVGQQHLDDFAQFVRSMMKEDGVAVMHNMNYADEMTFEPFIDKHIFPGAHIPALHTLVESFERKQLELKHYESWRRDYALTLQVWEANLWRHKKRIESLFQEYCQSDPKRFPFDGAYHFRTWLLYLMVSRAAFENGTIRVGHSVFVRAHQSDTFPFDYSKQLVKLEKLYSNRSTVSFREAKDENFQSVTGDQK